jgi:hypothetical protein
MHLITEEQIKASLYMGSIKFEANRTEYLAVADAEHQAHVDQGWLSPEQVEEVKQEGREELYNARQTYGKMMMQAESQRKKDVEQARREAREELIEWFEDQNDWEDKVSYMVMNKSVWEAKKQSLKSGQRGEG